MRYAHFALALTPGRPRAHPCPQPARPPSSPPPAHPSRCAAWEEALRARRRDVYRDPIPAHARRRRLAEAAGGRAATTDSAVAWRPKPVHGAAARLLPPRETARSGSMCVRAFFPVGTPFFLIFPLHCLVRSMPPPALSWQELARRSSPPMSLDIPVLARAQRSFSQTCGVAQPDGRARLFSRSCTASQPSRSASLPLTRHA